MNAALILQLLNVIQAAFGWLTQRGITKERALALLNKAEAEGRDVTTAEVQTELDQLQSELDDTADSIGDLRQ